MPHDQELNWDVEGCVVFLSPPSLGEPQTLLLLLSVSSFLSVTVPSCILSLYPRLIGLLFLLAFFIPNVTSLANLSFSQ